MAQPSDDTIRKVTSQLSEEFLREQLTQDSLVFMPVPDPNKGLNSGAPVWRVRFELEYDSKIRLGLDLNGEVAIGRGAAAGTQTGEPMTVTLFDQFDLEGEGVSRRHALLRPTDTRLYIIDLGSTNGTMLNGRSIGVNMPYGLNDCDHVKMGRLQFKVRILRRPGGTAALRARSPLHEVLPTIAQSITSQLDFAEVLKQAMDMAMAYTPADEISVWLVDEETGELYLEASRGMQDENIARLPVRDSLAGQVVATGKAARVNRDHSEGPLKLKTGYLVNAVVYVPLSVGGVAFGVLSAANHEQGHGFTDHDEKTLSVIAGLTATAVQNARIHQAARVSMRRSNRIIMALRTLMSHDLKGHLNTLAGYVGMLRSDDANGLSDEVRETLDQIVAADDTIRRLVDSMILVTNYNEDIVVFPKPCDVIGIAQHAIEELAPLAARKSVEVVVQSMGRPYQINADERYILRSIRSLIDNAIRFSPVAGRVDVSLIYSPDAVIIRILDQGPGVDPALLSLVLDHYVRSGPSEDGHSGLGLGLEVVRATTHSHRGTLAVRNVETGGAEFVLTLPGSLGVK